MSTIRLNCFRFKIRLFLSKGSIIALAWPETRVIREGKWYDYLTRKLGFLDGDHYVVGHAALVLIDYRDGAAHYFDFGRYHTPLKTGRVRNAFTDPELILKTRCFKKEDGQTQNLELLLSELHTKKATHGDGTLFASEYQEINFDSAYNRAIEMQQKGVIDYGPIHLTGTNCSRFVASIALAGNTDLITSILLRIPYTISPSPRSNIRIISNTPYFYKVEPGRISCYRKGWRALFGLFTDKEQNLSPKTLRI